MEKDSRFEEGARVVMSALASHMAIVVADFKGRVTSVLGPAEQAENVVDQLNIDPLDLEQPLRDVE